MINNRRQSLAPISQSTLNARQGASRMSLAPSKISNGYPEKRMSISMNNNALPNGRRASIDMAR